MEENKVRKMVDNILLELSKPKNFADAKRYVRGGKARKPVTIKLEGGCMMCPCCKEKFYVYSEKLDEKIDEKVDEKLDEKLDEIKDEIKDELPEIYEDKIDEIFEKEDSNVIGGKKSKGKLAQVAVPDTQRLTNPSSVGGTTRRKPRKKGSSQLQKDWNNFVGEVQKKMEKKLNSPVKRSIAMKLASELKKDKEKKLGRKINKDEMYKLLKKI